MRKLSTRGEADATHVENPSGKIQKTVQGRPLECHSNIPPLQKNNCFYFIYSRYAKTFPFVNCRQSHLFPLFGVVEFFLLTTLIMVTIPAFVRSSSNQPINFRRDKKPTKHFPCIKHKAMWVALLLTKSLNYNTNSNSFPTFLYKILQSKMWMLLSACKGSLSWNKSCRMYCIICRFN